MTSDAKIGLLLGLVFIFVIAFIINGLPNFGNRSQAEATPMPTFPDENLGVADSAQNAQEQLNWEALLEQESDVLAETDSQVAETETETPLEPTEMVAAAEGEDIRSTYTFDTFVGGVSRTIEDIATRLGESSRSTTLQVEASEPAPAIEVPEPKPASRPAEPASPRRSTPAAAANARTAPKFYLVQEGDVLATVAKKVYGPEEGNRLVNIKRLFEANRMTLESPDEIFVGRS